MLAPRIMVSLNPEESAALATLCEQDRRPPKHYLRWLVMQEAKRRGLEKNEGNGTPASTPVTLAMST